VHGAPNPVIGGLCTPPAPPPMSVRLFPLYLLNQLTFDLDVCTCILDNHRSLGTESQGHKTRSKSGAKERVRVNGGNAVVLTLSSILDRGQFVFTARRYASAVYAVVVCPSVLFVRHKPVLYRNHWTNRAGFWHGSFFPLIPHRVKGIWVSPKIRVLPSGTLS